MVSSKQYIGIQMPFYWSSIGAALVLIGSCGEKPDEAMDMAEEAYSEASSANAKAYELEQRIEEIEYRLNI